MAIEALVDAGVHPEVIADAHFRADRYFMDHPGWVTYDPSGRRLSKTSDHESVVFAWHASTTTPRPACNTTTTATTNPAPADTSHPTHSGSHPHPTPMGTRGTRQRSRTRTG